MVVVGLEHRRASLDLLGRVVVPDHDLAKALGGLRDRVNLEESVLLSTCLRTEVYAVVDRFHEAVDEIHDFLAERSGLSVDEIEELASVRFDDDVATHLFSVASGLESVLLGEGEVLGQVRRAWERASEERACGPVLAGLFRHAVETGKRVRSETAIARGTTSFSHAAVELAEQAAGGFGGRKVVVLGAGQMGAGVLRALAEGSPGGSARSGAVAGTAGPEPGIAGSEPRTTGPAPSRGPSEIVVVNRTLSRARALATRHRSPGTSIRAAGLEELGDELATADVLVIAVDAGATVLGPTEIAGAGRRSDHPLAIVDLGVPRSVDPAAGELLGVTVLDMDVLRRSVGRAMDERRGESEAAWAIVAAEVERYRAASRARGAAPVVSALRSRLEGLRVDELGRRRNHFGDLSDAEWEQVEAATRAVLAKLLHEPTVLLKETAGTPRGERLVEALRVLFDL